LPPSLPPRSTIIKAVLDKLIQRCSKLENWCLENGPLDERKTSYFKDVVRKGPAIVEAVMDDVDPWEREADPGEESLDVLVNINDIDKIPGPWHLFKNGLTLTEHGYGGLDAICTRKKPIAGSGSGERKKTGKKRKERKGRKHNRKGRGKEEEATGRKGWGRRYGRR